jgi:hypothetical protein
MKKRTNVWALVLAFLLPGCVGVQIDAKKEDAVTAGPFRRTLVVYRSGNQSTKGTVEGAFRDALQGTQEDPGRGIDLTDFAIGNPLSAAKLGYDSVLVVDKHSMVRWQETHAATLPEALSPSVKEKPGDSLNLTTVQSEGPGARLHVNACALLYDAVTTRLVWTAHVALQMDQNELTARPARVAADAVVKNLEKEGLLTKFSR